MSLVDQIHFPKAIDVVVLFEDGFVWKCFFFRNGNFENRKILKNVVYTWYKHVRFSGGFPTFQTHPDDFSWLTHPDIALPLALPALRQDRPAEKIQMQEIPQAPGYVAGSPGGLCPTGALGPPGALGQILLLCPKILE